jgi:hypothetical protein
VGGEVSSSRRGQMEPIKTAPVLRLVWLLADRRADGAVEKQQLGLKEDEKSLDQRVQPAHLNKLVTTGAHARCFKEISILCA